MTVYKPGDKLFERALEVGSDHRATPVIRTWTVLSVVDDPEYLGEDDRPLQVVTLRAFASKGALYEAEIAPYVDIRVTHGTWSRTYEEAAAHLRRRR